MEYIYFRIYFVTLKNHCGCEVAITKLSTIKLQLTTNEMAWMGRDKRTMFYLIKK